MNIKMYQNLYWGKQFGFHTQLGPNLKKKCVSSSKGRENYSSLKILIFLLEEICHKSGNYVLHKF